MKKLVVISAIVLIIWCSAWATGGYWILGTVSNIAAAQADVTDVTNATISAIFGLDRVYTNCTFTLNVTSLTGTTPSATVFLDVSTDGTTFARIVSFTACTAACNEAKFVTTATRPKGLRINRTTTGTITDLDYTVRAYCSE